MGKAETTEMAKNRKRKDYPGQPGRSQFIVTYSVKQIQQILLLKKLSAGIDTLKPRIEQSPPHRYLCSLTSDP